MTAAASKDVAFIVLLAGPAIPGDSTILSQIEVLGRSGGESDENIKHGLELERRVFATVRAQKGWDELRSMLIVEMRRSLDRTEAEKKAGIQNPDSMIAASVELQMNALRTPWFAFFISHDPAADLARIRCPVLALFGELDMQVAPSLNVQPMSSALSKSGNNDVQVVTISGANHLFQKAVTGSPAEYAGLEKKFADGVLDQLTTWLRKRFQ
jgi:pimeloyl-ACP methyl ester carboxylesterase